MSATIAIDYDALAKQAGAISSGPAPTSAPVAAAPRSGVPTSGAIDYDALAKQAGAISSTPATAAQVADAKSATGASTSGASGSWTEAGPVGGFEKPQAEATVGLMNYLARGAEIMLHKPKGSLQGTVTEEQPLSTPGELGDLAGNAAQWFAGENVATRGVAVLGDLANTSAELANASKYIKTPVAWAEYLKNSPKAAWLLKAISGIGKGATVGAVQGGVQGNAAGDAAQGARTGAELGGIGGAVSEGLGLAGDAIFGPGRAQKAAQSALLKNPWASARTAGQSLRTTLEGPISMVENDAKANYQAIDKAAGTDIKALYDKLGTIEENIRQTVEPDLEARLELARTNVMNTINDARKAVTDTLGPKASSLLDKADALYKRGQALRDVQTKVFQNPSIVTGNAAHGTTESVQVSPAVKALQKLADNTKYGASRLEQAFGANGAKSLLDEMYAAERAGLDVISKQQMLKTVGKVAAYGGAIAGAGYEAVKHFAGE